MKRLFLLGVGIISINCFDCACGMDTDGIVSLSHRDSDENMLGASLVSFVDTSNCDASDLAQVKALYSQAVDKSIFLSEYTCGRVLNAPEVTADNAAVFLEYDKEINDDIKSWHRNFEKEQSGFVGKISNSNENSWLIHSGNIDWRILNEGNVNRSIHLTSGKETTLVDLAISTGAFAVLKYLIYCCRNNINVLDNNGRNFVNRVIEGGWHELCCLAVKLIEMGYPFDENDVQEECWYKLALFLSMDARSCPRATQKLLDTVRDVNGVIYCDALLAKACRSNLKEVAAQLITKGANLREVNAFGAQPIHVALEANNMELVKLLVANGVSIEEPNEIGERPIHIAIRLGIKKMVLDLIEMGADFVSGDDRIHPPLQYVADCILRVYLRSFSGPSAEVQRYKKRLITSHCRIGKMLEERGAKMNSDSRSAQLYEKMKKKYI